MNLSDLAYNVGSWANTLPAVWRKRIYVVAKVLSAVATLALLILPALPGLGVNFTKSTAVEAALTAALAFLGHLASRNTVVPPTLDMTPAPEVHPGDLLDTSTATPSTEDPAPAEPAKTNPSG